MITISILGLDQYVVGHFSSENTTKLAHLFETKPENISFYAPNSFLFHDGIEQTSWNTLVKVSAPSKYRKVQEVVAKFLLATLEGVTVHTAVEFSYYQESDRYERINKEYPRFITDANIVSAEDDDEEDRENTELYEGNVFSEILKKTDGEEKKTVEPTETCCEEGCDCEHDHEEGCCEDGTCECDHAPHAKHSAK